ncbi:MAG: efflux RND transporter periplasmic adaptor subunit, partial [Betaproteobacteria bacterium]|nr:efflux RND transporter periplasmic adaptor subunit [Betaproteobacteria bacterium]
KSWHVDIGGRVKTGQLLAEIETPDLDQQLLQAQAELASAKANAALATTTAKRWQALLANDAVSRQEAEEKSGDLTTKLSVVNALQANLDRFQALKRFTRIVAPFDGVVTARSTDVGALINVGGAPGSELFVVSDTRKLRVYVSLPQNYVSAVKQGSKARLTVPENPKKRHAATVQSLSQAISAASGSMLIQLAADNASGELLPGGFANVSFDLPRAAGALSIPPSALIFNKSGLRVGTVGADGKVQLKVVTVARDLGSVIEIATGLSADDRVIESPPDGIADGDAVRIAVAEPKADPVIRPLLAASTTLLVLLLSACAQDLPLKVPEIPVSSAFKEAAPWTTAQPADELPREAWWTLFGDAELNALQQRLIEHSADLAAALARYQQSKAATEQIRASELPSLNTSLNTQRNRQSEKRPLRVLGPSSPNLYGSTTLGFDLGYEVDLWGRVRSQVAAGIALDQAAKADLASAQLVLQAQLTDSYVALRGLDREAALLRDTEAAYAKALDLVN